MLTWLFLIYCSRMGMPGDWEISWQLSLITKPLKYPHSPPLQDFQTFLRSLKSALLWKLIICSKSGNLTWQSNLHAREPVHYYMKIVVVVDVVVTFLYYCCRHIYGSYMSFSITIGDSKPWQGFPLRIYIPLCFS